MRYIKVGERNGMAIYDVVYDDIEIKAIELFNDDDKFTITE